MAVSARPSGSVPEAIESLTRIRHRISRINRRVLRSVPQRRAILICVVAAGTAAALVAFTVLSSGTALHDFAGRSTALVLGSAAERDTIESDTSHNVVAAVPGHPAEQHALPRPDEHPDLLGASGDLVRRRRANAAAAAAGSSHGISENVAGGSGSGGKATRLGNRFCILQPTLSAGRRAWDERAARDHIALRAFMRTFAATVLDHEKHSFKFAIYYGHDSDDPVFGDMQLRNAFEDQARNILRANNFTDGAVDLVFTPLYGLHSRVNAIWNFMAKDAFYDGCDYFFMSNDDMVFFTQGWVTNAVQSLDGSGSPAGSKRPCRYLGTVRFKDEWADWATFTFHVSTRLHLEIFGGVYYPVPYNSAHNDYWIHQVYDGFGASKFRGQVKVRNRVADVEYALAHQKDTTHVAPPRYKYDKKGDVSKYIRQGRARVHAWLEQHRGTDRCAPPL
jgi:hypothetical protein